MKIVEAKNPRFIQVNNPTPQARKAATKVFPSGNILVLAGRRQDIEKMIAGKVEKVEIKQSWLNLNFRHNPKIKDNTLTVYVLDLPRQGKGLDLDLEDGCTSINSTILANEEQVMHSLTINLPAAKAAIEAGKATRVPEVIKQMIFREGRFSAKHKI